MPLGQYAVLELHAPGAPAHNIGILLLDPASGRLHLRVRDDLAALWPPEREVLEPLVLELVERAEEMGGAKLFSWLEDTLSNVLRLTDRVAVHVDSFTRIADRLYEQHVSRMIVLPFNTHLPLYSLKAAAGKFGAQEVVEEEEWVRAPEGLRLRPGMFVAHVVGHSMEPRIPDGSLNVFQAPVVGSRQSKIVLIEMLGEHTDEARYTLKRYTSEKRFQPGEEWCHGRITLHPLNAEFQPFDLADGDFRVIAEWIQVLE